MRNTSYTYRLHSYGQTQLNYSAVPVESNIFFRFFSYYFHNSYEFYICSAFPSLQDFNKAVGVYSQSIFLPGAGRALTATSCGNIVVWSHSDGDLPCNRKAFKIVKMQDRALTVLTSSGK